MKAAVKITQALSTSPFELMPKLDILVANAGICRPPRQNKNSSSPRSFFAYGKAPGRLYIRTYGFSVEGWGLASILTALFTSDEGGAEGERMTGDDYFINAPVMNNLFNPLMMLWNVPFVFSTRFRDFASFFLGRGAISVQ
eukprot:scaffold1468_cov206-Alexandrium_tamarense.AAC.9